MCHDSSQKHGYVAFIAVLWIVISHLARVDTSVYSRIKSMKGWINLHEHLPYKDVRRLVYALLNVCDRQCIEIAHGVRREYTFDAVLIAARNGHMKLVRHMRMTRVAWDPNGVAVAASQSGNEEFIVWATNPGKFRIDWKSQQEIMLNLLQAGRFQCAWNLYKQCFYPVPAVALYYCVVHNNLNYAQKFNQIVSVPPNAMRQWDGNIIDAILEFADVRFYRYATLMMRLVVSPEQEERAREKWPELNKKRKV